MSREWVQRLAHRWRHEFDWRALEKRLNHYPQFVTEIEGQDIHFLHVRSGRPDALALVLTHGWPGTVVEYLDIIEPLTAAGYDLVIPSVPGSGFSGPTSERGWDVQRIAGAWVTLMHRLGYQRYAAVGNDGGSMISPEVGRLDPDHVVGVHVTQLSSFPTGDPAEMEDMTPDELAAMEHLSGSGRTWARSTRCTLRRPRPSRTRWPTLLSGCSPGTASCSPGWTLTGVQLVGGRLRGEDEFAQAPLQVGECVGRWPRAQSRSSTASAQPQERVTPAPPCP